MLFYISLSGDFGVLSASSGRGQNGLDTSAKIKTDESDFERKFKLIFFLS
jgi:hypothetical protein